MVDIQAGMKALIGAKTASEIRAAMESEDGLALFANVSKGAEWRNFAEQRLKMLETVETMNAEIPAPPAIEEALPPPPPTAVPPAPGIGILGITKPAEVSASAASTETPTAPELAPEPAASAATAAPLELSIMDLARRSKEQKDAFKAAFDAAYQAVTGLLGAEKLRIDPEAEFVDLATNYAEKALKWLVVRCAKGEMTPEQAVEYAKKATYKVGDKEIPWTEELSVRPEIYKAMMARFRREGLYLVKRARVNGDEIDVQTRLGQALERGEIDLDQAVATAIEGGWTREFHEDESSIGAQMRAKEVNERDQDRREREGRQAQRRKHRK